MAEKKFFWLKLRENFFEDETIEWLEEQENGKDYVLFYLKLCLKSLKHEGMLYREVGTKIIPYDAKKLAEITKTPFDTVIIAVKLLEEVGLIQKLDNETLYLTALQSMVGSSADNSNAERQRRHQLKKRQDKALQVSVIKNNASALENITESIEYRDKSIEIRDKSIEYRDKSESDIGDKSPSRTRKNQFTPPTLDDVNSYMAEKGIHNVSAKAFIDYYEAGDWHDAKGNKVKSWKQKLLTWSRTGGTEGKEREKRKEYNVDDSVQSAIDLINSFAEAGDES